MIKKILITLIIIGLCVSAFFIRLANFKKPGPRTVDEVVYYIMARQMQDNIFEYSAVNFALDGILNHGKQYPDYFHQPVFKHPPLFTLMTAGALSVWGPNALGGGFCPLFFGALSIALVYLMGQLIAGRSAGLIAAGLMWIDPVAVMSSQKVWMDAPLMFFMLLTVYGYWRGAKERNPVFFFIGGVSAGAAFLIKYPGILTFLGVVLFFLMARPVMFRSRPFRWSLILPVVMSLPWAFWNYYVYGMSALTQQIAAHEFSTVFSPPVFFIAAVICVTTVFFWVMIRNLSAIPGWVDSFLSSNAVFYVKAVCFIGFLGFSIMQASVSLDFSLVPSYSWRQGFFAGEPGWFYLKRLLHYSLIYAFGYLAFFDLFFKSSRGLFLIKLQAALLLLFFTAWGNFQCRYVLPALPFFMILSADYIVKLFKKFRSIDCVILRLVLQSALLVLITLSVSKTMVINAVVSFTNNMCYF